jgi:hypothetical protein
VGEWPNYTTVRKPGSLEIIQYSLVRSINVKKHINDLVSIKKSQKGYFKRL